VIRFDGAFFPKVSDRINNGNPTAPEAAVRKNPRLDLTPGASESLFDILQPSSRFPFYDLFQ